MVLNNLVNNVEELRPKKRKIGPKTVKVLFVLILLASMAVSFFFYSLYRDLKQDSRIVQTEQTAKYKGELSKLILIDETEEPTVATVKDIETLKKENADFYRNGKNGDILFIFSRRAILFDSSRKIVVNVAPIVPDEKSTIVTPTPSVSPTDSPSPTSKPKK